MASVRDAVPLKRTANSGISKHAVTAKPGCIPSLCNLLGKCTGRKLKLGAMVSNVKLGRLKHV